MPFWVAKAKPHTIFAFGREVTTEDGGADPTFWTSSQPLMRLEEAAIAPANPAWMKTLALFPGESTYAEYALEEGDPKTDMDAYRDYKIRHIRRLEVRAKGRRELPGCGVIILKGSQRGLWRAMHQALISNRGSGP